MATHPREPGSLAAAGSSVASNTAEQRALATFQLLPADLKTTIISMACSAPGGDRKEGDKFLSPLDPQPAKAMALVSKSFYAVACSVLYAHIRVTRISSLKLLLDAVISRPPLGHLIKSLHIGPDDEVSSGRFPLTPDELILRVGLPQDQGKWPTWINTKSVYRIPYKRDTSPAPTAAVRAIEAAVQSACCALDVDVERHPNSQRGLLTSNEWICRLFEAFAALELYVLAMRHYENEAKDRSNHRYPRLIVTDDSAWQARRGPDASTSNFLVLSRWQLHQRLATRYSEMDRFDNQLIFLRSGLSLESEDWDPFKTGIGRLNSRAISEMNDEDAMDAYSAIEAQLEDPALPSTATIGGVLSLARALLSQAPLLRHLSLSGFLTSAVCGARAPAELRRLQSLSLGPPPFRSSWPPPLRFDIPSIASVERLLLSGHDLSAEQAAIIVGQDGAGKSHFPRPRRFRWSCPWQFPNEKVDISSRLDTINVLAGRLPDTERRSAGKREGNRKRARDTDAEDEYAASGPPLHIEVRLKARGVERLLAAAPTAAAREAWRTGGKPERGYLQHCRLRLVKMPENNPDEGWQGLADVRKLHDEGREWLEEGTAEGPVCC